jgi:hypothetical protein
MSVTTYEAFRKKLEERNQPKPVQQGKVYEKTGVSIWRVTR